MPAKSGLTSCLDLMGQLLFDSSFTKKKKKKTKKKNMYFYNVTVCCFFVLDSMTPFPLCEDANACMNENDACPGCNVECVGGDNACRNMNFTCTSGACSIDTTGASI